jgi:hypothetical protein
MDLVAEPSTRSWTDAVSTYTDCGSQTVPASVTVACRGIRRQAWAYAVVATLRQLRMLADWSD